MIFKRKEQATPKPRRPRWDDAPLVPLADQSASESFFNGGLIGMVNRSDAIRAKSHAIPQPPPLPPPLP